MTLNIGNPSLQRVRKQIDWIEHRDEDIFVLTETKVSEGCSFLEEYFGEQGQTLFDYGKEAQFNVFFPRYYAFNVALLSHNRLKSRTLGT